MSIEDQSNLLNLCKEITNKNQEFSDTIALRDKEIDKLKNDKRLLGDRVLDLEAELGAMKQLLSEAETLLEDCRYNLRKEGYINGNIN